MAINSVQSNGLVGTNDLSAKQPLLKSTINISLLEAVILILLRSLSMCEGNKHD